MSSSQRISKVLDFGCQKKRHFLQLFLGLLALEIMFEVSTRLELRDTYHCFVVMKCSTVYEQPAS